MEGGKRILITGAAGSIGSELVNQLAPHHFVYGLDINESVLFIDVYEYQRQKGTPIKTRIGDIRDLKTVEEVFHNFQPEIVFHAAALKHVTPLEHDPEEGVLTNIIGTSNLVKTAKRYGIPHFINISTDKAASADMIMGMTKRIAERIVKNAGYISVRFGNVMGSRGSLLEIWQRQIDKGEPLTLTDENMERYFMTIEEAVSLVIGALEVGEPGDIVVLDMDKPKKILDMAKEILGKLGKEDYPIKTIGMRPGEHLTERLMTLDEEKTAQKKGRYWIVK